MMILWVVFWALLMVILYCSKRSRGIVSKVNGVLLLLGVYAILRMTLIGRHQHTKASDLYPISIVWGNKKPSDYWRVMLLSFLLFLPFGTALPYCLSRMTSSPAMWSLVSCLILSIIIEIIQYGFELGMLEVDDIICNVGGGALGMTSYLIYKKVVKSKSEIGS